jgi:hypothetical protein
MPSCGARTWWGHGARVHSWAMWCCACALVAAERAERSLIGPLKSKLVVMYKVGYVTRVNVGEGAALQSQADVAGGLLGCTGVCASNNISSWPTQMAVVSKQPHAVHVTFAARLCPVCPVASGVRAPLSAVRCPLLVMRTSAMRGAHT